MVYKSVYIIGPRLEGQYDSLKGLYDGEENIIIGDGKRRITEEDIAILAGKIDSDTKIIVQCHAGIGNKELSYMQFDIELFKCNYQKRAWNGINNKDIEKLWHSLNKASNNQPLQINLLGCHIGLAKDSAKCLPLGSILMMYSPKDDYGWSHNHCEIIKSIMASKHLNDPFQVFLDNILTNLSNCGASIATNAPIGISYVSFAINSESLKHGVEGYLNTVSYETIKFYTKNKYYFKCSSIFTNSKLAAEQFFQSEGLKELSFTESELTKFMGKIIEAKTSCKDPNSFASIEAALKEEHKQLKLSHGNTLLHHAVNEGKVDVMEKLIKEGFNIDAKNNYGNTPLHLAAINGNDKAAEILIQNGADVNAINNNGDSALHQAIKNGNPGVALYLIANGADVNAMNNGVYTPLHVAAEFGQFTVAAELIKYNADVNAKNKYGNTPLHWAAKYGKGNVIDVLIKNGADVNAMNNGVYTPLHCAAKYGKGDVIDVLIKNGADVNAMNKYGSTPLHCAAKYGKGDVIDVLIKNGADVNAMNNGGESPLSYAAKHGQSTVIELLIEKGAYIYSKDIGGYTPIQLAAANDHLEVVKLLLDHGAKNTGVLGWIEWFFGSSAEQIADENGNTEIADYIRSYNNSPSSEASDNPINHDPVLVNYLPEHMVENH
jgi:ankyrin repeat protein